MRYTIDDADELYNLPLPELGKLAHAERLRHRPEPVITFVLDRNITHTNICVCQCRFCAYYVNPGDEGGFVMAPDEVIRRAGELADLGGTQIMLQGGVNPDLGLDYYSTILRGIKEKYNLTLHSLSPPEIFHLAEREKLSLEDTLLKLREAGLDSLPGGGAEILVERVRARVSPHKITAAQWFDVMRAAHSIGMKSTATMVFGHEETVRERWEHIIAVRNLQDETGGFRAFIPWPFSPGRTEFSHRQRTGGEDYLRMVAVSRLLLDNVDHIHSGWVTEGPKIAQVALAYGANDFGGVLMEEVVVGATGVTHQVDVPMLKRLAEDMGYKLARRDTEYKILEYV